LWDTVAAMGRYAGSLWQAWIKPPAGAACGCGDR